MAKLTQEEILSYLEEATILELNDLVSAIEEKFGVVAAAAVAAPAAAAEEAAGPSEVTVTLTDVGGTKVAVIKAVREITGLGLALIILRTSLQKEWTRPVAGSLRYMLSLRWYSTVWLTRT